MNIKAMVLLIVGIVAVAVVLTAMSSQFGTDYEEMAQGVASVSAGLGFLGICLIALTDSDAPKGSCALFGGFAGIVFAFIVKTLHDGGILIDEFITGSITIGDLMTVIVILWLLIGIIMEVLRS